MFAAFPTHVLLEQVCVATRICHEIINRLHEVIVTEGSE